MRVLGRAQCTKVSEYQLPRLLTPGIWTLCQQAIGDLYSWLGSCVSRRETRLQAFGPVVCAAYLVGEWKGMWCVGRDGVPLGWGCERRTKRTRASQAATMRRNRLGLVGWSRQLARPTAAQRAHQLLLSSSCPDYLRRTESEAGLGAHATTGLGRACEVARHVRARERGRVGGSPPRLSESEKELERLLRVELEAPGICLSPSRVDASPQFALDSRPSTTRSDGVDGLPQPKMPRFAGVAAGASR